MPRGRKKKTEYMKRLEQEAHEEANVKRGLVDLRRGYTPEPTVKYKVGQRVVHGGILKSIITRIYDGGKHIKLYEWTHDHNYGRPIYYQRFMWVRWTEIRPYVEKCTAPVMHHKDNLQISYSQRHVISLIWCYYGQSGIDDEVEYQRGNVWTEEDQVKLIDSIYRNIDIGKFVIIRRPYKENEKGYEILDGKQRLGALRAFYEGRIKYKGYTFQELSSRDRHHFTDYPVSWGEIGVPHDLEDIPNAYKYEYFLKLNTYGHVVSEEHLKFVESLYEKEKSNGND